MPIQLPDQLPRAVRPVLGPVFEALTPQQAMTDLIVTRPRTGAAHEALAAAADHPTLADHPAVRAAMWIYVDDLDAAHGPAQHLNTPAGSFLHAIVHRREGDFPNALYWYRKTGPHPVMSRIDLTGGGAGSGTEVAAYDPYRFVERVQKASENNDRANPALVSIQNKEWRALFAHLIEDLH